jgi:hypothetical protein
MMMMSQRGMKFTNNLTLSDVNQHPVASQPRKQPLVRKRDSQAPISPYPAKPSPKAAHKAEKPQGTLHSMIRCSWIQVDRCLWFARMRKVQTAITNTQ